MLQFLHHGTILLLHEINDLLLLLSTSSTFSFSDCTEFLLLARASWALISGYSWKRSLLSYFLARSSVSYTEFRWQLQPSQSLSTAADNVNSSLKTSHRSITRILMLWRGDIKHTFCYTLAMHLGKTSKGLNSDSNLTLEYILLSGHTKRRSMVLDLAIFVFLISCIPLSSAGLLIT